MREHYTCWPLKVKGHRTSLSKMCHFRMWITLGWSQLSPKRPRESFYLPLQGLKVFMSRTRKRTVTRPGVSRRIRARCGKLGGAPWGPGIQFPCVPLSLHNIHSSHLPVNRPLPPLKSHTPSPSPEFRMAYKPQLPDCCASHILLEGRVPVLRG